MPGFDLSSQVRLAAASRSEIANDRIRRRTANGCF